MDSLAYLCTRRTSAANRGIIETNHSHMYTVDRARWTAVCGRFRRTMLVVW
jgi:hypothetical protein